MANIVVILDDPKLRKQIAGFVKELGEEDTRVRFFASAAEFSETYFIKKKEPPHPLSLLPGLATYSREELETVLELKFAAQSAIPHPKLQLRLNPRTGKIESTEPGLDAQHTVLGIFPEDLMASQNVLSAMVHAVGKRHWDEFWRGLVTQEVSATLPLSQANHDVSWLKLTGRTNGSAVIVDLEDVTSTLAPEIQKEKMRRENHAEESDELQLFSEIHLILFKDDCVGDKPIEWLEHSFAKLKASGYVPQDRPTRFILLKFEDDPQNKLELIHPRLDDLIYLPLDRLIFLQKIQLILGLPEKIDPEFLFTQETKDTIEVSKIARLEKINDVGLVIRNPVRLVPGLLGHFYITWPGEANTVEVWAKAIKSEPHPEAANQYLVHFMYFGMRRIEHQRIRQLIGKKARLAPFHNLDRDKVRFNPDDLFLSDEDKRPRNIVILDLDENASQLARQSIKNDFDLVNVHTFSSYAEFATLAFGQSASSMISAEIPKTEEFYAPAITLQLNPQLELNNVDVPPKDGQFFLGHNAVELLGTPKAWQKLFWPLPSQVDWFQEAAALALQRRELFKILAAQDANGKYKWVSVRVNKHPAYDFVMMTIAPALAEEIQKQSRPREKIKTLDLLILDVSLATQSLSVLLENLRTRAAQAGLIKDPQGLKIILTTENERALHPRSFENKEIIGLFEKPADTRLLNVLTALAIGSPYTLFTFENLPWLPMNLPIHVAREAQMVRFSEFGVELSHPRPIAPGTVLFLRQSIFNNAPRQCLAARFYHCAPDPNNEGHHLCSAIYFGINDSFMKFARRWFRETYAATKQAEGT